MRIFRNETSTKNLRRNSKKYKDISKLIIQGKLSTVSLYLNTSPISIITWRCFQMSVNSDEITIDEESSSSHQLSLRLRPRPTITNADDENDGSVESMTVNTNIWRRDRHLTKKVVKMRRKARISAQIESKEASRMRTNFRTCNN